MRISDWSSDVCSSDLLEHEHWPDLDPALGGLIPPAPNREVHASVTDGTKRRFRKKRRVEERINTFRHLTANRIGAVWSPLDHDVRAIAPRSEEHTYELQSLIRTSSAVFCLKEQNNIEPNNPNQ